jgi:predicted nucleic acid-binding protein
MTPVVIDADAVNCLRSFGLLHDLEQFIVANSIATKPLLSVGYVARHELNQISNEIERLEKVGVLGVVDVLARSPASVARRALLQRHPGVDKGEAEAIAWLLTNARELPFVSCDVEARRIALVERLTAWDTLDLVHEWIVGGVLSLETARTKLAAWSDNPGARWRPRGFEGVEATLRQRYGQCYLVGFENR